MSPEENAWHWWNWWVQVATAVGTMGAVILALFLDVLKDWVRYRFLPPQLRIGLRSTESEEISNTRLADVNDPSAPPFSTKSRWYHIRVTNDRQWVEATDVQVVLLRIEEPDAAGLFTVVPWAGEIPLRWRYMEIDPAATKTVGGRYREADLVAFFKDSKTSSVPFLLLQPMFTPNRLDRHRTGVRKHTLRLVLVARERQVESKHLTIQIDWNGEWPETDEQAKRCIVIREVAPS